MYIIICKNILVCKSGTDNLIIHLQGVSYHITDYTKPLTGCRKWAAEHQLFYPDENELRKECEDYMAGFDQREKLKLQREKEMAETPDEVSFVNFDILRHIS